MTLGLTERCQMRCLQCLQLISSVSKTDLLLQIKENIKNLFLFSTGIVFILYLPVFQSTECLQTNKISFSHPAYLFR